MKSGRQVLVKGKKVHISLAYINDINNTGKFVAPTDFTNIQGLLDILKQNALLNIQSCLELFSSTKYKGYTNWEKFYQTFQLNLIKMATSHSYFIAAFNANYAISTLGVSYDNNLLSI